MTSERQKKAGYLLPSPVTGYPLTCVQLLIPDSPAYRAALNGAIYSLTKWYNWEKTYEMGDTRATEAATYLRQIIEESLVIGDCSEPPQPDCNECKPYPLNADFIDWAPANPFTDPYEVPAGYRFSPWYVVRGFIPFTGLQAGDLITDLLHGPVVEPVSNGFPRLRIHVNGTGEIQIRFVRFPTAGIALITIDDSVTSARWVDLHTALAASVGNVEAEIIIPIKVDGAGAHHVDISMVFSITEAPPFVHFGGGIRGISLCGFNGTNPTPAITTIIEEIEMPICTQLRFHEGRLQGLCCFNAETGEMEWVDISGQDGGFIPSGVTQPTSVTRPTAGQSKCYEVLLAGNNQWQLPFPVNDGDTISVTNISGAWSDGNPGWYCAEGWPYILGQCVHSSRGHAGGDPDATDYHMQLIGQIGSTFFPATDGPYTVPGGTGSQTLIFQANDGTLSDNRGSMSFKVCVQSGETPPEGEWCYIYDFTLSDYDWEIYAPSGNARGKYVSGQGFTHADSSLNGYIQLNSAAFDTSTVTSVELNISTPLAGPVHTIEVIMPDRFGTNYNLSSDTATDFIIPIDPPIDTTGMFINVDSDDADDTDFPVGYLTRITLRGTGANPFGSSNC